MRISSASHCILLSLVLLSIAAHAQAQQPTEIIIRNGTVVTSEGRYAADVRVRGATIVEIGQGLSAAAGAEEIDADGLLLIPGGVDPHVHLGGSRVDDYTSGSAAALAGGITTISNLASPGPDETLAARVEGEGELVGQISLSRDRFYPSGGMP